MSVVSPASSYQLNTAAQDGLKPTKSVNSDSATEAASKASSSSDKVTLSPEARALFDAENSSSSFNGGGIEPPVPGDNGGGIEPPNPIPPGPTDLQSQAFNGGGIEPPKK